MSENSTDPDMNQAAKEQRLQEIRRERSVTVQEFEAALKTGDTALRAAIDLLAIRKQKWDDLGQEARDLLGPTPNLDRMPETTTAFPLPSYVTTSRTASALMRAFDVEQRSEK